MVSFIDKLLQKDIKKGRLTEDAAADIKSRILPTTSIEESVSDAELVIEAVPEISSLKESIFKQLAELTKDKATILATNTSSISITKIAAAAKGAESRVVAAHFMNPVPVQRGVEIISGLQTNPEVLQNTIDFIKKMGKTPSTSRDAPGFLANRILLPYINEAIICLETGVGEKEDIDNILKNGCAMPMGPLALADFIGLDTCLAILKVLHNEIGDSKYRPATLLSKYVDAGWLGVKSGKGFYDYPTK